jgi:peptide/nickel transport system substrate-binding protein/oligopeptide transport system substrate-binding protein
MVLLILLTVVPASSQDQESPEERQPQGRQQPKDSEQEEQEEGKNEFVMAMTPGDIQFSPIKSFTSAEAQLYTAIYEGLVTYNPATLDPEPGVAARWEVGPQGRVYTFYLRNDARYWNGDPVLAEHFRDTWLEVIDPETDAAYSFLFDVIEGAEAYRNGNSSDPDSVGIEVISRRVLRVTLAHPATHFLDILAHHSFSPLHPRMRQAENWDELPSILGNGPYYIVEQSEDELVLSRNELYWDHRSVSIPKLRVLFRDSPAQVTDAFSEGEIDWVSSGIALDRVQSPQAISIHPMFATRYFYLRGGREPFGQRSVRRALALLIPWKELRSSDFHYIPATTLVPPIPHYPEVEGITEQNVDEALKLLEEAGYPEGKGLPPVVIKVAGPVQQAREARLIRDAIEEHLEAEAPIDSVAYNEYYDALDEDEYVIGSLSWIGDFADPLTFLQMWTSESNLNDARYANAEYDQLVRDSMSQTGNTRYETLAEAETMLLQDAVVLPISHSPAVNLIKRNLIEGWYPNPLDIHPFKHLEFGELEAPPNVAKGRASDRVFGARPMPVTRSGPWTRRP